MFNLLTFSQQFKKHYGNFTDFIMSDDENVDDLSIQLQDKAEEIRMWYQNTFKEDKLEDSGSVDISPYEKKMLDSCYRWHINSHIRLDGVHKKS